MHRLAFCALLLVLFGLGSSRATAQVAPQLGYLFPPAIQAGKTQSMQLGGYELTPDTELLVHDADIQLKLNGELGDFLVPRPPYWFGPKAMHTAFLIPREFPVEVTVAAGAAAGPRRWQVANANGSSAAAVLLVSDHEEIVEQRDRDLPHDLTSFALPLGVSGRLERIAEVDTYLVKRADAGPVTVEFYGRRLGSDVNGAIEVRDPQGKQVADVVDTEGLDTAVTFGAQAGATYQVRVHDLDFRGNHGLVYRLVINTGPRVAATIPAAGQRGQTQKVTLIGYGVSSGAARLESVVREISFPADPQATHHTYRLETPHGNAMPIEIPLSDLPEQVVTGASPQTITEPVGLTGTWTEGGQPSFAWDAAEGDIWDLSVESQAIGTDLDLALDVLDGEGKQLATNDDLPGTSDAGLTFKVPKAGRYLCRVRELSGKRPTLASLYRLRADRQQPGFTLSTTQQINVGVGGMGAVTVKVTRQGGFEGPIDLQLEGLPKGVQAGEKLQVPEKKAVLKIDLTAAEDAPAQAAIVRITGTATIGDTKVQRPVTATAGGNLCPRGDQHVVSTLLLCSTLKPPFELQLIDKNRQRAVHRGTTYPAEFIVAREDGYQGEVLVQMASKQGRHRQGIHGPVVTAAPGQERVLYPSFMPEWLETDRTTRMAIVGIAKVKQADGKLRYVTKAADARITMILEGALLKVSQAAEELEVTPGETFEVPFSLSRSAKLPADVPIHVELLVPEAIQDAIQAEVLSLGRDQDQGRLQIKTTAHPQLHGTWKLHVRARTQLDDRWPVISQAELPVRFAQ